MNIIEALSALDPAEADDWTKDGLPKTEAVSDLVGEPVTRAQITEAAPNFTKDNPVLEVTSPEPEVPAEPGTDPEDASNDDGDDQDNGGDDGEDDEDEDEPQPEPAVAGKDHPAVVEAMEAVAEAEAAAAEAGKALKDAQANLEAMIQKYAPRINSHKDNQKGIMDHIKSQMANREAQFANQQAAAEALGLTARSPIDAAMERKTGHGLERPAPRGVASEGAAQ